ncbi:Superkiller protein 3 [Allomyces arbusculus]|nr:Superkiller protein 3 [Allomyces arbusculus]
MFAARVKTLLKKTRDALGAKDYAAAYDTVNDLLGYEPANLNALLFKALAAQNLEKYDESEVALNTVLETNPELVSAWQGLEKLHEKAGNVDKRIEAMHKLVVLYYKANESKRLTDIATALVQLHTDRKDWAAADRALRQFLPDSPIYDRLADPRPSTAGILQQLATVQAAHDAESIAAQVQARKGMLGGPSLPELQRQVERAVHRASPLLGTYEQLLHLNRDLDMVEKYLGLLTARVQGAEDEAERGEYAAKLRTEVAAIITRGENVRAAYQLALDWTNAADVREVPEALLRAYLAAWPLQTAASDDDDATQDEYAVFAQWVLDPDNEPDTVPTSPSLFGCLVTSCLASADKAQLDAATRGLDLVQTTKRDFAVPLDRVANRLHLTRAKVLLGAQLVHDALRDLDAVDSDDFAAEAFTLRGEAYMQLQDWPSARAAFTHVRSHWAQSNLGWLDLLQDQGDPLTTLADVDSTALAAPHQQAVHAYRLGRAYWAADDGNSAFTHLLHAAQRAPLLCTEAFTYLGHVYAARGDAGRAAKCWAKAFALDPRDTEAARVLVRHYWAQGEPSWSAARDVLKTAADASPRVAWIRKQLGLVHLRLGNVEDAATALQAAGRLDFRDAVVWQTLAECYLKLGRYLTAYKAATRAIELDPEGKSARYLMAVVNMKLGQYTAAHATLDADASFAPSVILAGELYLTHARDAYETGRYAETKRLLDEGYAVMQAHPTPALPNAHAKRVADLRAAWTWIPHLWTGTASVVDALNEAVEGYAAIECHVDAAQVLFHVAQLGGDAESAANKALAHCKQALAANRHDPAAWTVAGCVYAAHLAQPKLAQHCLVMSLHLDPRSASTWTALGLLYLANDDGELAHACLEQATMHDADAAAAWATLQRCTEFAAATRRATTKTNLLHHAVATCAWVPPAVMREYVHALRDVHAIDAEFAARKWTEWDPTSAVAWNAYGCLLERNGNHAGAVDAFKQALRIDRTDKAVVGNLARALAAQDPARAVDMFSRMGGIDALARDTDPRRALVMQLAAAMAQCHAGQWRADPAVGRKAIEACTTTLARITDRKTDTERKLLAQLSYQCQRTDSIPTLVDGVAPGLLCALGLLQGRDDLVGTAFDAMPPRDAQYMTSIYLLLQGDVQGALRALQRAAHMFPGHHAAWARLARFLARYSSGKAQVTVARGVAAHDRIVGEDGSGLALATVGLLAMGDSKAALRMAQRQAVLHPTRAAAWRQVLTAMVARQVDEVGEAADRGNDDKVDNQETPLSQEVMDRVATHVLRMSSTDDTDATGTAFAHLLAAHVAMTSNDAPRAMHHGESAVALLDPDTLPAAVYRQLARTLAASGDLESASAFLKQVMPTDDDAAVLELAQVYARAGWRDAATALLMAKGSRTTLAQAFFMGGRSVAAGNAVAQAEGEEGDEQVRVVQALAALARGMRARAGKMVAGVERRDLVEVWEREARAADAA